MISFKGKHVSLDNFTSFMEGSHPEFWSKYRQYLRCEMMVTEDEEVAGDIICSYW